MATGRSIRLEGASPLSQRETAVLEMVASGRTNTEAAEQLGVSVHAIKFHLASIYRKLGVSNRTEAAITFLKETR
jgi:DNA-binding NarL/FixJ family response regulator